MGVHPLNVSSQATPFGWSVIWSDLVLAFDTVGVGTKGWINEAL